MNNEEKILQMLTKLTEKVDGMDGRLDAMDGRLDRLETTQAEMQTKLAGMQAELAEVHEIATKVAVTQEAVVLPRLDALADGHTLLVETLAKKEQVEDLEERQDTLEGVVELIGKRLMALEKAQ